tara:strand:- start:4089 stop:4442 length:354 start_codon:yes stop_codon:yes gene_type:complete
MAFNVSSLFRIAQPTAFNGGWNKETLTGAKTLTTSDAIFHFIDPDGNRNVTLPTVSKTDVGRFFVIANKADGTPEEITLLNPDGTTCCVFDRYIAVVVYVNDSGAWTLGAKFTIVAD